MLTYFGIGESGIEVPTGSCFQRRGQHDLWRDQFCDRALRVGPGRTSNPPVFYRDEINAFERVAPIDFESLQIFVVEFLDAAETVAYGKMLLLVRSG